MPDERTIPALDALAEAERLAAQLRLNAFDGSMTADALDRQTAVLRMVLDVLARLGCPPKEVESWSSPDADWSLPTVRVPASRWLEGGR